MSQAITPLRLAVWNGLLDAERYVRYYGALAKRYRYQQQIPRWIMALAAVTGAMPMVFGEFFPPDVSAATGLIVLGAVAWDLVSGHGHKAAILDAICVECGEYETQLRDLWIEIEQGLAQGNPIDVKAIRANLTDIESGFDRVTSRVGIANVADDDQLNVKAMDEANRVLTDRFTIGAP